jgi:hypothetical protein
MIRAALAIKLAGLATARKNHGFDHPIRFWNGKLQSLRARIATRAGRSSWRTAVAGRPIYGIRSIVILDSRGQEFLLEGVRSRFLSFANC